MKKLIFIILTSLIASSVFSQKKVHYINLNHEDGILTEAKFYIQSITDNRKDTVNIGIVQKGAFNTKHSCKFEKGISQTLFAYYESILPKENAEMPISVKINGFKISERSTMSSEYGVFDLDIAYYHNGKKVFIDKQHLVIMEIDVTPLHEGNIRKALLASIKEFAESEWMKSNGQAEISFKDSDNTPAADYTKMNETKPKEKSNTKNKPEDEFEDVFEADKNIVAVGYQIGGYNLIGIDYELRLHDAFGIHVGTGFVGYTGGVKIHTSPKATSGFFNVSYKDLGFGLMSTAGVEYGNILKFSQNNNFGLLAQIGIHKILDIDPELEKEIYKDTPTPPITLSLGIGFAW